MMQVRSRPPKSNQITHTHAVCEWKSKLNGNRINLWHLNVIVKRTFVTFRRFWFLSLGYSMRSGEAGKIFLPQNGNASTLFCFYRHRNMVKQKRNTFLLPWLWPYKEVFNFLCCEGKSNCEPECETSRKCFTELVLGSC